MVTLLLTILPLLLVSEVPAYSTPEQLQAPLNINIQPAEDGRNLQGGVFQIQGSK